MARFDPAFDKVLVLEGGYVDHPSDPGGATNLGISLRYLLDRGDLDRDGLPDGDMDGDGDVDVADIRAITPEKAKHLYHTGFWIPNRLSELRNQAVAEKIFDMAVNMGSRQAWRLVQRAVNDQYGNDVLVVDGVVGPKTLLVLNGLSENESVLDAIKEAQAGFYLRLIDARPSLAVFRDGWLNRAYA